ncbi:MAG: DUF4373 domain-containing protein [Bacteroides sp.]|nr:DUF4373 domain-containing protein [Bacteroides sp.]
MDFFDSDLMAILESKYGCKAALLAIKLISKVYSENYFYRWGEDELILFTHKLGVDYTVEYVKEVVEALVSRGFFDKGCYEKQGILTSAAIQLHYFEASQRRKCVQVERAYLLIDIKKYKNLSVKGEAPHVDIKPENVDIPPAQPQPNAENAYIPEQMKRNEMEMKASSSKSSSEGTPGGVMNEEEILSSVPRDGVERNTEGLLLALDGLHIPVADRPKLVKLGNWGAIGHPIWKAIYEVNNSGGRITQPAKFIYARLMKKRAG